ncbi:unnamed protein product [Prunus armeniaca]|uniref:RNase H type-1 domain-containing protein n=1 Tax=Prunus armeniaca TaxID=36596 RepID=A0A6J5V5J6_PRUAR|nr:unnamed protein product [Prunus armeniaca]
MLCICRKALIDCKFGNIKFVSVEGDFSNSRLLQFALAIEDVKSWLKNKSEFITKGRLKNKSEFITKGRGLIFTFALDPEKFKTGTGSPPRRGWFKVNSDAAWKKDTNRAGIGAMIRDSKGLLCGGSAESMICHSVLEAEAEAALGGLKLALLSNYRKVTMETDSLVLKAGVDGKLENRAWKILPILLEIRLEWSWIPRKKNLAAHAAASFGIGTVHRVTWLDQPPPSLMGVLTFDGLPCPPVI